MWSRSIRPWWAWRSSILAFPADARVHVLVEDGRAYVRHTLRGGKRYDLIMLDAYDNQYIPEHMLTREFLSEVRSLLQPDGIVAANTFSSAGCIRTNR